VDTKALPGTWLRAARDLGARGDVAGAGSALLRRWAEEHRGYHDLQHLAEVLDRIEELSAYAVGLATVRTAAFFHDAVYDPPAQDNEERSAAYAELLLSRLDAPAAAVGEVMRLVRLTATHDPSADDPDGAVLCDADLAVLASGPERYAAYVRGVRREYAHLDDAVFAAGRAQVLRRLAGRPALYATDHGRRRWERPARENLERELRGLSEP
jgi:predicted metal-dependent HD superfamily phosphohydrolase